MKLEAQQIVSVLLIRLIRPSLLCTCTKHEPMQHALLSLYEPLHLCKGMPPEGLQDSQAVPLVSYNGVLKIVWLQRLNLGIWFYYSNSNEHIRILLKKWTIKNFLLLRTVMIMSILSFVHENMSSRFSRYSEAFSSEFLKDLREVCYLGTGACIPVLLDITIQLQYCIINIERVKEMSFYINISNT